MTLQIQIYTTLSNTRIPLTPSDRSLVFPEIYSYSSSSGISYFSYFVILPLPFLFASPSKLSSSIPIPPTSAFSSLSSLSRSPTISSPPACVAYPPSALSLQSFWSCRSCTSPTKPLAGFHSPGTSDVAGIQNLLRRSIRNDDMISGQTESPSLDMSVCDRV